MNSNIRTALLFIVPALAVAISACAGSTVLGEPKSLELQHPLAVEADSSIAATLDWVVVKDGPGTWASNAFWDEYRLRLVNHSDVSVSLSQIQVVDSLAATHVITSDRRILVDSSERTQERYRDQELDVAPGAVSAGMLAAGVAGSAVAITAASYAAASGTASALGVSTGVGASPAVVTMAYVAPVLIVGSILHVRNNARVDDEINSRQTTFPVELGPGESNDIVAFFPIAPSPQTVRLIYQADDRMRVLEINTTEVLAGLHYRDPNAPSRRPREGSM